MKMVKKDYNKRHRCAPSSIGRKWNLKKPNYKNFGFNKQVFIEINPRKFSTGASILAAEQLQKGLKMWWSANSTKALFMGREHQLFVAQIESKLGVLAASSKSVFRVDHALQIVKHATNSPAEAKAILLSLDNKPGISPEFASQVKLVKGVLPPGQTQASIERFLCTACSISGVPLDDNVTYLASDVAAGIVKNAPTVALGAGLIGISTYAYLGIYAALNDPVSVGETLLWSMEGTTTDIDGLLTFDGGEIAPSDSPLPEPEGSTAEDLLEGSGYAEEFPIQNLPKNS